MTNDPYAESPYAILGVTPGATRDDIERAWAEVRRTRPNDRRVHEAFRQLTSPDKRQLWDTYFPPEAVTADARSKLDAYFAGFDAIDVLEWRPFSDESGIIFPPAPALPELALEEQWFDLQHMIQHDMAKAILADAGPQPVRFHGGVRGVRD